MKMASDSLSKVRHETRTLLNHIVGYSDILMEDAALRQDEDLKGIFGKIRDKALLLREPILQLFSERGENPVGQGARETAKRKTYGLLYDIITLVQTAKRSCSSEDRKAFLPDLQKILEAANATSELFEEAFTQYLEPGNSSATPLPDMDEASKPSRDTGSVLVVDDDAFNREILTRHLERQGHRVAQAPDGAHALKALKKGSFDLVLLDVMMPGMNGYQFLERIRQEPTLQDIPVIVISALEESRSVARCLRLGAEDYLPREFDPLVLRARIESCLERNRLRTRQRLSLRTLEETQSRLADELHRAGDYVRSLLPRRVRWKELQADWVFLPSLDLGGDAFGYTRLDNGEIALYLMDVSGHGIEAALLSVSLLHRIQAQSRADPELWDPARMLTQFNRTFRSEDQNILYYSAWVGLWNPESRILRYSCAGSPPAALLGEDGSVWRLRTESPAIGVDADADFTSSAQRVPPKARLFLFSDGIFECRRQSGRILGLAEFMKILKTESKTPASSRLSRIVEAVRSACGRTQFEDDVSLVGLYFDA